MNKTKKARKKRIKMAEHYAQKHYEDLSKLAKEMANSPEFIELFGRFMALRRECSPPRFGLVKYDNDGWTKLRPCFV